MNLFFSIQMIKRQQNLLFAILTLAFCSQSSMAQDNLDLAIANEVIINSNPLHDNVAERYLENATGEKDIEIISVTNSATKLSIPLSESAPEGSIIEDDQILDACKDFQNYIRKLRSKNAEARRNNERPNLVYNFQCSPNGLFSTTAIPNDPRYSELWAASQVNNIDMDLPEAWDKSTGRSDVVVAVIDTGIDYNHPDLAANMWKNTAELNGQPGIDDDNDGYVDDIYGINAIYNSPNPGNPFDDNSHGTHVSGTISGAGNNRVGVVGAAWNVKLMGAKFLSSTGSGSLYDAITAIDFVTNKKLSGVNIVAANNSWGGGGYYPALRDAIVRMNNAGVLFIAAAGNSSTNIDASPSYPASYDVENVISVGAIDANGALAYFSNYGTSNVDIVAPGVNILSSIPGSGYAYYNGTSMATPQVSGAIALLKSYAPAMTLAQLRDTLFSTGKSVSGAIGKSKYGTMPSVLQMMLEADRLGLGGVVPSPTATSTPRPTATPTNTPTPTATPTPEPTLVPGYFALRGVAKSGSEKIARAKVSLQIGGRTLVTYTDANGAFSFLNVLGPANYTLNITSAGHSFNSYGSILYGDVNMVMAGSTKNYTLIAKIIDQFAQPIVGVKISDTNLGDAISSSEGVVQFNIPYGSNYSLNAEKTGLDFLNANLSGQVFGDVTRTFVILPD